MRRLAFDFPKQPSTGPDSKQKKAKPRQSKVRICQWGCEKVDARVRKLLMRNRNLKPARKRENQVNVTTQTKKPLGKFGRGDSPHEYWEEERRIREIKARGKLAKMRKSKPKVKALLTDKPSGENEKGKVEIESKASAFASNSDHEQEDEKQINQASDYIKDTGSHKVLHYFNTQVTPSLTLTHSEERKVKVQKDTLPFASRGKSDREEERQSDLGSTYIKDNRSHKVFDNLKSKVQTWREDPSLTSSSESEQEEETQMDFESSDKYIKDWNSHKVLNKYRIQNWLQQLTLSDLENDSGSQFGDVDSEYEENENDETRKKTLKRGRGGAAPCEWQQMAEEERMKMVAIKRNKMVRIAQQVKWN